MIAFVDESLRSVPCALYLVAAVVSMDQEMDQVREQTREVLLPRQPLFHWRNENEQQRHRMMRQIAGSGATVLAYRCPMPPKPDRARVLCLNKFARPSDEPLLWLADAMAGAISAHLGEGGAKYLDFFSSGQVKTLEIQP